MALTKAERKLLEATHTSVAEITTAIKGMNGKGGLLSHVDEHDDDIEKLKDRTSENSTDIAVAKSGIRRIYWLIGGTILGIGGTAGAIIPNL